MSVYALVNPVNSVETIANIIVADETTAAAYRKSNGGDYDYVLDLTSISPAPGIGWTYDPGENSFTAPPIDYATIVRAELSDIHSLLQAMIADGSNLSPEDLASALAAGVDDISGSFTTTESDLIDAVVTYVENGG